MASVWWTADQEFPGLANPYISAKVRNNAKPWRPFTVFPVSSHHSRSDWTQSGSRGAGASISSPTKDSSLLQLQALVQHFGHCLSRNYLPLFSCEIYFGCIFLFGITCMGKRGLTWFDSSSLEIACLVCSLLSLVMPFITWGTLLPSARKQSLEFWLN